MYFAEALVPLNSTLSLTAALVNESRARRADLSMDRYAREWIPANLRTAVSNLWDEFSNAVYQFDDIVLSVRNRFFFELIERAAQENSGVIVAPCGLTSYPYLMSCSTRFLEIDLPAIVRYKTDRALLLAREIGLPQRDVRRLELDLTVVGKFAEVIKGFRHESRLLIVLEGFSYYLKPAEWCELINQISKVFRPGDKFAFDYWSASDRELPTYERYKQFCAQYAGFDIGGFNFIQEHKLADVFSGWEIERASVFEAETKILGTDVLSCHSREIIVDRYLVATCP